MTGGTIVQMSVLGTLLLLNAVKSEASQGIDVSRYQGVINWKKVHAAGVTFSVARATIGAAGSDPYFPRNWRGMRRNHIVPAAYHYFKGAEDAAAQYSNIASVLGSTDFDKARDVLAIDVEQSQNVNVSAAQMALTLQQLLTNLSDYQHVYIYSNYYYWEGSVAWQNYDFSKYPLWIANYNNVTSPLIPTTWKSQGYTWWQYSDTGSVDGIAGYVDLDRRA